MAYLFGLVEYRAPLHAWDEQAGPLIEYTQSNALLETQRAILATEFPRRRFETQLGITVGSIKATKGGSYWIGRERHLGIDRLGELLAKRRLGNVSSGHIITKTFEPGPEGRHEGTSVSVGLDFTRPDYEMAPPHGSLSVSVDGPFGELHIDRLVGAAWRVFRDLVEAAPTVRGVANWTYVTDGQGIDEGCRESPNGPAVGSMLFLPKRVVDALGGDDIAASQIQPVETHTVHAPENAGAACVLLGVRPGDLSSARAERVRSILVA